MENFSQKAPENLCKKCGMCCRVVTSSVCYEELIKEAQNGDKDAADFLSVFIPYSPNQKAREVYSEHFDNIVKSERDKRQDPYYEPVFYCCKYLNNENVCTQYEKRPDFCKRMPSSPWCVVPPCCGYTEWLKEEREKVYSFVKNVKEVLSDLEKMDPEYFLESQNKKVREIIEELNKKIEPYLKYGAKFW